MLVSLPHNWRPRDYQRNAWSYLEHGGRHAELVWHRRGGKDDVALHHAACASFERVGNYWHMLPQANQARKALWLAINPHTGKRRIDEAFPPEVRSGTLDNEMLIRLRSGSTWQVVGSDNFNSLVGSPPIGLVFSEWALCDPAAWAYLMPIIEENGGWVIFNTTPRGRNHAFRSLQSARGAAGKFGEILTANQTDVFDGAQLAAIERSLCDTFGEDYGKAIYDQEYLCSFDAANLGAVLGRALARADQQGRIDDAMSAYDPDGAALEVSSDIGHRDASTWWFWQPCFGGFRIVDYDRDSGLHADEWCDRLERKATERGYRVGKYWLPHDAKAKTFVAHHTTVEVFVQRFGVARVGVVPESSKQDRINAARRVIERVAFHRTHTERGRDGLAAWAFVYDEERKEFSKEPDHNWASHDGDGFSYGCQVMSERLPADEPEKERRLVVGANETTMEDMWRIRERGLSRVQRV